MENKETLEPQSGGDLTSPIDEDKIGSFEKQDDGGQPKSEKAAEGDVPERTKEGYLSHGSEDTIIADPQETPPRPEENPQVTTDDEYVTGIKAMLILAAVTAACFIMLLDISIVATVS